ncbi:sugar kinase [Neolewinella lacunae]|uniref:Sugar kinase n=1 Tax=Neolewinella lacunae TaxID=1517758 RepID=A0A923PNK3_9BACT|nr:sugar kinase [Neolewinella lacunae]MBC6994533.1 sugar kinase [Neolewinella lacunae]MDN3634226.1 sugar kinase [Neolewinella lacunae]
MPEIVAIGELLIDLISTNYADDFQSADHYQRLPGGSPANLAMNLARLGRSVALVATVGQDDAGTLLLTAVREAGVDVDHIARHADPTTLILVTKSRAVSNFEPYRLADRQIGTEQLPDALVQGCQVIHTTAFALSKEPARSNILASMAIAAAAGAKPSVDFNYADKIWGDDRAAGLQTLTALAAHGALVKVSEVDYERLFGEPVREYHAAAARIQALGASVVCLTLGPDGCYVLAPDAAFHLPARPVEVKDTTGAGDAFWSGFLAAHVAGYPWYECALAGRGMAEKKLTRVGAVLEDVVLEELLE